MELARSTVSLLAYSFVSSANSFTVLLSSLGRSLMYITKRVGPSTLPCGMPLVTAAGVELHPFTCTLCVRPVRNAAVHFSIFPCTPSAFNLELRRL